VLETWPQCNGGGSVRSGAQRKVIRSMGHSTPEETRVYLPDGLVVVIKQGQTFC
jgi:hypothetical protein